MVGKQRNTFYFWVIFVSLSQLGGLPLAVAQNASADADELEELLDKEGEDVDVETEEEYALPVPAPSEERSPVLNEADAETVAPGDRNQDLFLPVPSDQAGLPAIVGEEDEDFAPFSRAGDVRYDNQVSGYHKPAYAIFGGPLMRNYGSNYVQSNRSGFEVGLNGRIISGSLLRMPLSLHAIGSYSFVTINTMRGPVESDLVTAEGVTDETLRFGLMAEMELSRRFQLFAGVFKFRNTLGLDKSSSVDIASGAPTSRNPGPLLASLSNNGFSLGLGAQWDFFVIPYASIGVRAWWDSHNIFSGLVVFSLEPRPRNRNSLNFEWDD